MPDMQKLSTLQLPDNSEYYIQDDSAVASISRSGTTCTITYRDGHTSIVHGLELEGGVLGFYIVDPDLEPDTDSDSDYNPNANKIFIPVSVPLSGSDTDGLMSYQDYLKLSNIESGAEVNQFAFGKVRVSQVDDRDPKHPIVTSTDLDADDKVDTFEMMEGDNVTLVPNVPGDKVTIHAKDTTYILSYERSSEIDSDSDSDSETEVIYHNTIKLTNNLDVTDVQTIPIQDDVIYKLTSDSRAGTITLYGSNGDTYTISVPYAGHAASADYADESGHANLATADADSDTISETYATNIDIDSDSDGHYQHIIQLKNKQGNVIASVEVPDNDTTYTLEASSEPDSVIVFRGSDGTVSELATGKTYTLSTDSDGHIVLTSSTGDVYSVIAPNAEHADLADEALHSSEADYADEAGHSSDADHADLADEALHSSDADHAIEADHSSDADHADLADEAIHSSDADHATNADYANHAVEADHSSEADHATSATYAGTANKAIADADSDDIRTTYAITIDVDRDSDDDITVGLKNKNGVLISTDTVPKATQSDSGLMSASDKTKLDGIATGAQVNVIETVKVNGTPLTPDQYKAVDVTVPTKLTDLENDSDFVQDKSYVHTDNNYTTTEKNKLAGIASGAEVNQNAFSIVKITKATSASTSLSADSKTDTVEVIEGTNITLTPDASKDKLEISAKDTTYTLSQDPTDGHKFKLTNNLDGTDVQEITIPDSDTTYHVALDSSTNSIMLVNDADSEDVSSIVPSDATTTLHGYMSASDKVKLNGIATGAEVNQNAYSTVKVGSINVSSSSKTGTLTLVEGANITLTPNTSDKSVTIASSYTNTTYTLTQDGTDGHKFTLSGTDGYSKTITIPDNNTTYTLSVGTGDDANKLIFTPSSGTATKITVPFATNATNAVNATNDQSGNNIKSSYASSVDISGHTLTLKSKDGTTLSTKTLPDNDTTYTFAEGSTDKAFTVTPKGGTAQTVPIHGLGAASTKGVSTVVTDSDTNLVTGGAVATAIAEAIDNLPEPMIFKGTLGTNGTYTTLPTAGASTEGWTLKVITADTYPTGDSGTPKAKVGDMFICRKISSSSFEWVWIPSGDDVEDTWRGIKVDTVSKLGNGISTGALDFTSGNHIGLSFNSTGNKLTIAHADTSSQASVTNSGRTYIQSVTLDGDGHVTGLTSGTETVVNTDRYVNSASFADDTSSDTDHPVKMTLTRSGSDSVKVEGNIPKVSSTSAGVAPKGASVSTQSQSTKFLREDGSWAKPSYTTNTDRYVNSASFAHDSANSNMKMTLTRAGSDTKTVTANIPVVSSSTSGVAPKGNAVTTQTTSTKFLREDGSWAAPSYTENTDRYVNSASFADDTTASASSPVKMTLTRAGSDTATVTGNIPKVSSSSAGVAPKGSAVSSQSQSTKFLREDGTWAKPSYTTNTDTKVTAVGNHYTPAKSETKSASSDTATDITNTEGTAVITGIEMDAKGHVTGIVSDKLKSVNTTYSQGTGISISGTTINHSNSVTAGTASEGGTTRTLTFGGTFNVPGVTYDAQGHITSTGSVTLTLPANPNTDTKVTSVGNHYSPSANPSSELSASATGATAAWGIDVVQGVQVQRDAKGHVTGVTVTSGKIPSNPNTDEKVTQTETTSDETYELLFSGTADSTTRTEGARKSGNLTFNPSMGALNVSGDVYTKAIYMSDSQSTPTQSNRFGWYQWGDQVQFTYRNSQNKYLGQAFAIFVTDGHSEWNKTAIYKASMYPNTTDTYYSGDANRKWKGVYATTFYGNLDGNASSASSAPWSGITDKPSTFPPSAHTHSQIVTVGDKRSIATVPTDYVNALIFQGLKNSSTIGSPSTDTYSYLVGLRGWTDSSGGNTHEFAFNNSGVYRRQGATDTWGSWMKLIDSVNYTDYTVKKDGTGATGTWGINISGTAGGVAWSNVSNRPTKLSQFTNDITFATSIATSTGTNQLTLSHGGKYALTAGGTSFVFTMPSDNNTTYTFAGGTNGFTVTPSGGSAQTVTVTPSIANNITGSGTSGYLAKFNGANTITNGPALGSSTTTFLRNDGTWATPTDTNNAVTQTATNTNATYEVLFSGTADNTTRTEGARKYSNLTFNPSTGTLTTTKVVSANATLGVADIDTANITEDNVGNLIVTGASRFLNTINGSISGNAATADDAAKLNGYASDTSATGNTVARRNANGYIFATYFNQSSGAETPTSSSYIIYANSDGYFRKSTVANMKTAMSLNNVENKSSATIRGELTSANVTTALGYTPVNKAGDTMSGTLKWDSTSLPEKASTSYAVVIDAFADGGEMGWRTLGSNAFNSTAFLPLSGGTLTGRVAYKNVAMPLSAGKVTSLAAGTTEIFKDGIAISNPTTSNDVGWMRVTGTGESDTVLEIATGDDGGGTTAETIVVRQYNTSNAIAHEAKLLDPSGNTSFPGNVTAPKFIGNLQGNADTATSATSATKATQDGSGNVITSTYLKLSGGTMTGQITSNYNQAASWLNCGKYPDIHINNTGASGWIGGNTKTGRHVICTYASSDDLLYFNWYSNTTLAGSENKFDKSFTWNPSTNVLSANISGNAATATTAQHVSLIASNEIRFANKPSSAVDVYFNYQWADGTASAMINKYVFMNGNKTKCPVEASTFIGPLQGNADTATKANTIATEVGTSAGARPVFYSWLGDTTKVVYDNNFNYNPSGGVLTATKFVGSLQGNADTATKATQDESGNNIKATYAASFTISDHTITLKNKNGASLGTVTVPDNNTTYTIGTSGNNVTLTPSSGTAQSITVPYATNAGTASNLANFENNNSTGKNANDVTYNAHTYYTSNGPSTSIGASTNDGALYTQAYSTVWVGQIAQDYRNGNLFTRSKNNGTWQAWRKVAYTGDAPTAHNQSADTITSGYLNIQPENSPILIPFMNNDLAYMVTRGGSTIVKYDGTTQSIDISGCFDAGPGYGYAIGNSGDYTTIVMELTLHQTFAWTNTIYVDFGSSGWRAKDVEIEVMNSNYSEDTWTSKYHNTSNTLGHCYVITSHTPSGASSSGGGFNKIRFTFKSFNSAMFRIAQLGVYNYGSAGLRTTYMSRGIDDAVWRSISPATTNTYNLGSSSLKWKDVYATTFHGALDGNATSASYLSAFRATIASANDLNALKGDGIKYANVQGNIASNYGDGLVVAIPWSGNANYAHQLYFDDSSYVCGHRALNNGTWSDWKKFIDEVNYTDYTVTKTGTGASGTWGISISGNAATATTATTATTARKIINDAIRMTSPNTAYYDGGLRYYLASSSMTTDKPPLGDGKILDMQWDNNGGWATQLYITHSNTNTDTATRAMLRSQNGTTWKSWIPVAVFNQTTPTSGQIVVTDGTDGGVKSSGTTIASLAPLANPTFTGTPKAPTAASGTSTTQIATTEFVMNTFRAQDAMIFKGTIGSSGATVTTLPATHDAGWTYKVITAGTYAGQTCEIGDMVVCIKDGTTASDADWSVIQNNIDGAVIGPASASSGHVVVFDGTTGKLVKDSGFTIGTSVPANAIFTDKYHTTGTWSGLTYTATANGGAGELKFEIPTGTTATTVAVGNHTHSYLPLSGGTLTGNLTISHAASANMTADSTNPKITFSENGTQPVHIIYSDYDNYRSPAGLKVIGGASATPAWFEVEGDIYEAGTKLSSKYLQLSGGTMTGQIVLASTGYKTNSTSGYVVDQYGNFKHQSTNTGEYWVISNNAGTAKLSVYWETGKVVAANDVQSATVLCANTANSSTAGGLSLYGTDPTAYGVIFRGTGNQGKHGYVTSDWATYFTMSNTNNRGWVFRRQGSGNVASIDTSGQMVLNGSLTLGGNEANTSGCRLVMNENTKSLDFIFVA